MSTLVCLHTYYSESSVCGVISREQGVFDVLAA